MSQTEIIERELLNNRGKWVAMTDLAKAAKCFAVNSRVADIRRKRGLTVLNRVRRVKRETLSFYQIP